MWAGRVIVRSVDGDAGRESVTRDEAGPDVTGADDAGPEHFADRGRGTPPRIVVGIDGSPPSRRALQWAARQADLTGATLEVLMTWDWPVAFGWSPMVSDYDPEAPVHEVLDGAVAEAKLSHHDVGFVTLVRRGHPAQWLVDASKGADLLVVGSRGHGEFVGMLVGSVSEHCVAHAHCPVLVYRDAD